MLVGWFGQVTVDCLSLVTLASCFVVITCTYRCLGSRDIAARKIGHAIKVQALYQHPFLSMKCVQQQITRRGEVVLARAAVLSMVRSGTELRQMVVVVVATIHPW